MKVNSDSFFYGGATRKDIALTRFGSRGMRVLVKAGESALVGKRERLRSRVHENRREAKAPGDLEGH
ncbi:MAG TPA: hypothetical protein VF534_36180 [Paraburkholderia sp.]